LEGDLKKNVRRNNMKVGSKRIHTNTCVWNYKHPQCKNCVEKRCKRIIHNGIELKICWPILMKNSEVIPVGLHWDFSVKLEYNKIVKEHTKIKVYDGLFEKIIINTKIEILKEKDFNS
jgi:hypothetical protein